MTDFITAIGLVFVIEGAFLTLFPEGAKRMMDIMRSLPVNNLRLAGMTSLIIGSLIAALVHGF